MLILILIDVQYSQKAVFSFEKDLSGQNHSSSGYNPLEKNSPSKISTPPLYTHTFYCYLENQPCSHKFLNNIINMSISVFQSSLSSMKIPKYLYGWWHTVVFYIIWAWDQCPNVSLKILQHLKSYFHSIRRQVVLSLFQVLC